MTSMQMMWGMGSDLTPHGDSNLSPVDALFRVNPTLPLTNRITRPVGCFLNGCVLYFYCVTHPTMRGARQRPRLLNAVR
jgi:hypothetical protein